MNEALPNNDGAQAPEVPPSSAWFAILWAQIRWNYYTRLRCYAIRAWSWIQWLPYRRVRASLPPPFHVWGGPAETLRIMSKRFVDQEERLNNAHREWGKWEMKAKDEAMKRAAAMLDPATRKHIKSCLGIETEDKN